MKYPPLPLKELKKPRRSKYGNTRVDCMGFTFDSILERDHYLFLRSCEAAGKITQLELQPRIPLSAHGRHICDYIADFRYRLANGRVVYSDAKGCLTDVFRIKWRLFEAQTGYKLHLVGRKNVTELGTGD
ncbi:DUF1064 domain-containing protein [Zavarzinella formosa]|uniref:DUF1064 domain-containing protein n=1 Tax=Zavarzinella formosa TaxID=360055 RepID=UPI00037D0157|nr:DUF1064 domain-containing protein [Zavarzinella formosa]